jgi:putative DNA methylase
VRSFIEVQFPISKLSKESYKERKSSSQTLGGLGKWWGRKPLILVRATILGLLLPATDDPQRDREIFLKLLMMDEEGLWLRKTKAISLKEMWKRLTTKECQEWFAEEGKLKAQITKDERKALQKLVFSKLSYDEKLEYCDRPEQMGNLSESAWQAINAHLRTNATNLSEFAQQLGIKRFGHIPRVGDAFCGGGSIPFEAARIGCEAYGSDLNPVAALLTWAALNIVGGGEEVAEQVRTAQKSVYEAVDRQITEWGIEHNDLGWRADAYLYCVETVCPECGWKVPLAPSWVIGEKTKCVAKLAPIDERGTGGEGFQILIESNVSDSEMTAAKKLGTVKDSKLCCPHCHQETPMTMIRGDRKSSDKATAYGLRMWENDDLVPRPDDVLQERLYCIRWVETYIDEKGKEKTRRLYCTPDAEDLQREARVLELLKERFSDWQDRGYIPSRKIEEGAETTRLSRERGWTHWHHLFNPRQLLIFGCLTQSIFDTSVKNGLQNGVLELEKDKRLLEISLMIWVGKCTERNSKIMSWDSSRDCHSHVFTNQALNTFFSMATKPFKGIESIPFLEVESKAKINGLVEPLDCRAINKNRDVWITDPPYADAVNYHELSGYFLSWYEKNLKHLFPDWYTDSKHALAITGKDSHFRESMSECYRNLANNMPDDGMQVVMFTHQDASVWADLALILWASGLRVTAAWCIATETDSALKAGNYVQGTVLLILRKQTSDETAFLDEIYPKVELEVKRQLDEMLRLEDKEEPNFGDTDYQLAAYAAALRVLTQYQNIEDIDIQYELSKIRKKGDKSPIVEIIDNAVKIACDYLVPATFDSFIWKSLTPEERFYLKGLDIESHGEYRSGAYQELARGFGLKDYKFCLETSKANENRLKTATEFASKNLGDLGFGSSLTRTALYAIREVVATEDAQKGKMLLRSEIKDYWNQRKLIIEILKYLGTMEYKIPHWQQDAKAAMLLAGAVENDNV